MVNIACIFNTLQCVILKLMSENDGVDLVEYAWFRNATILVIMTFILSIQKRNPITAI